MEGEWPTVPVSELEANRILLVQDGNHGEYRPRSDEFVTSGVAFIRAADMEYGRVLFESAAKINDVAFNRITKGIGQPGDVLLSHKGTVGKVAIAPMDCPAFVCSPQTTFWRTLDHSTLDRSYLYAYLRGQHFHDQLATRSAETDMAPYVSLTSQRGLSVIVPPVTVQRAIGRVVQSLDDKIELNRRMNATLEGISRAIFKSWFVDFDPVRQKAAGKQPVGMSAQTAALFPDSFGESAIGGVPKGWTVGTVRAIVEGLFDGPHATPAKSDTGAVFLGIDNMTGTGLDLSSVRHISEEDWPRWTRRVTPRHHDIVFSYEATIGFFSMIPKRLRCCLGRRMALVRPLANANNSHYLYHWFIAEPFQKHLHSHAVSGATVNRVPLLEFPSYPVLLPHSAVMHCFEHMAAGVMERIQQNQEQNATLAALRNALLPKLLSGELRISEAEDAVTEAIA